MRVGFYLDNSTLSMADFRHPELGNPGTGAAAYLHVALPYFISKYSAGAIETHIFAQHTGRLPEALPSHSVANIADAASKAKAARIELFVFRPRVNEEDFILDVLDRLGLSSIGIAALTPSPKHIRRMAQSSAFKALVCVGREQYDSLIDTPVSAKLAQINNGVHVESCGTKLGAKRDPLHVVYMGALVPQKGFPLLATAWPQILRRVPEAKLSVIGSPKIYKENAELGPLGLADSEFEGRFVVPNLTDSSGKLLPSVTFHGQMGVEKYELINRAAIGVPNPTGNTETFCVSAAEMSACGAAIVSGAFYGLLDTVKHGVTGLLGRTLDDLINNLSYLLQNADVSARMGMEGHRYARESFDFSVVVPKWRALFQDVTAGKQQTLKLPTRNLSRHFKYLRVLNTPLQSTFGRLITWPSVQEIERTAKLVKGKLHG